jgi:uncharacterized paraquat-inducible protein A
MAHSTEPLKVDASDLGRLAAEDVFSHRIVSAEYVAQSTRREPTRRTCRECRSEGHPENATCCHYCGARLPPYRSDSKAA